MTEEETAAVDLAIETKKIKVQNRTRVRLPEAAFLYYRDRACVEEITRATGMSGSTINKLISIGLLSIVSELLFDTSIPAEHTPYANAHKTTEGRWSRKTRTGTWRQR